jgi:hypothetical protein
VLLSHTSALRIAAAASTGATKPILEFVWSRGAFGDLAAARERNFSLPYQYALEPRGAAAAAVLIGNRLPDFRAMCSLHCPRRRRAWSWPATTS